MDAGINRPCIRHVVTCDSRTCRLSPKSCRYLHTCRSQAAEANGVAPFSSFFLPARTPGGQPHVRSGALWLFSLARTTCGGSAARVNCMRRREGRHLRSTLSCASHSGLARRSMRSLVCPVSVTRRYRSYAEIVMGMPDANKHVVRIVFAAARTGPTW